jgi:hypothetical protein
LRTSAWPAASHTCTPLATGIIASNITASTVEAGEQAVEAIPGFGVIVSTAVVATMTDPKAFPTRV